MGSVADIFPHSEERDHWVPASELRRIVLDAPADPGLLDDLEDVREAEIEDADFTSFKEIEVIQI